MTRQLTEAEVARRAEFRARSAVRRTEFQAQLLEAEAQRAAAAPTIEVMTPQAFVTKLASQGGPLARTAEKDGQHGKEADHQG